MRSGRHPRRRSRGFTLIETMFAIVIIGLGVVVILRTMMHFLYHNMWSTHSATATYLAGEIREMTRALPRHDRFSGGLYFTVEGDPDTLTGWGFEPDESTADDIDDLDDLDGVVFGNATQFPDGFTMSRRLPGPVNAFGERILETDWSGEIETIQIGENEIEISMRGWSQLIEVEKVDPADYATALPDEAHETDGRLVDEYPLRVTVTIVYDGSWDDHAPPLTQVSWIIPP